MKFYIVDCFAQQKYQGNQLAVFVPDYDITAAEMQQIAREMNFSETTFILSDQEKNGGYRVRIFTPAIEVPFAGHPTLGTAYVINQEMQNGRHGDVILNLEVGPIKVKIDEGGITMYQNQPEFGQTLEKKTVAELLQIETDDIRDDYPIQWVSTGLPCFIIPLKDTQALQKCVIHHDRFRHFIESVYQCNILVFTQVDPQLLKVRVFMDDPGYLEDPATGSANGNLAGYMLKYDYFHSSSVHYAVSQGTEIGRPSTLRVSGELSEDGYHIRVGGKAFLVAQGTWN